VVRHVVNQIDPGRIVRDEDTVFKVELRVRVHALKRVEDDVSNKIKFPCALPRANLLVRYDQTRRMLLRPGPLASDSRSY
jgi:hypothetical protein